MTSKRDKLKLYVVKNITTLSLEQHVNQTGHIINFDYTEVLVKTW